VNGVLRQAVRADIPGMHRVRLAVRENRLTSSVIREEHYVPEIEVTGRGWVITEAGRVVAFAVGNREAKNIWALFVDPERDGRGYGRRLHDAMVEWLFSQGVAFIWLSTDPGTRAQRFYEAAGWRFCRVLPDGEHHYELRQNADPLPRTAGHAVLRRLRSEDLEVFRAYREDPLVGRYQGWSPMSQSAALAFINEMAVIKLFEPGEWAQLAIARTEDGVLVGDLGLFVAKDGAHAEVGFTLSPAAQGRGYGAAAVAEAIRLVFEQTAVRRVVGITDARNTSSVRLLERVGMSRVEAREVVFKGETCTEWVYAKRR
jgi:RimJ/RimL family protein N-acetyltransferase